MAPKPRKLWATRYAHAGAELKRHETKAAVYRWVQNQVRLFLAGSLRVQRLTVFVDERDGQGYQTYELIDLAELVAADEVSS